MRLTVPRFLLRYLVIVMHYISSWLLYIWYCNELHVICITTGIVEIHCTLSNLLSFFCFCVYREAEIPGSVSKSRFTLHLANHFSTLWSQTSHSAAFRTGALFFHTVNFLHLLPENVIRILTRIYAHESGTQYSEMQRYSLNLLLTVHASVS
jgi:hypothetical protein